MTKLVVNPCVQDVDLILSFESQELSSSYHLEFVGLELEYKPICISFEQEYNSGSSNNDNHQESSARHLGGMGGMEAS